MNLSRNQERKIQKKVQRCKILLSNEIDIQFSETPTENLAILNAGLSTGLTLERLLEELYLYNVNVQKISMIPGKSYCFITLSNVIQSQTIFESMNALAVLGQDNAVIYLSYCKEIPKVENPWVGPLPPGLILLENFITDAEQEILVRDINILDDQAVDGHLKHRIVKHFGYEFIYGKNNVDPENPLDRKIPSYFHETIFERLHLKKPEFSNIIPDQMTVNRYEPGQGIPAHCDTHSAFEDPIMSLSLLGDTVMEFKNEFRTVWVYLPRKSLLIMSGESRFGWTHGIIARMTDVVQKPAGLTVQRRGVRISCTFRKLKTGPCQCNFLHLCDSQKDMLLNHHQKNLDECDSQVAARLEKENVHAVYDEIASHFSETRHSPWPQVVDFLKSFNPNEILLDVGCGNGKYLNTNPKIHILGCDRSEGLLKVCTERFYNVFQCDCLAIPFKDNSVDGCISIAVIHHLVTEERRKKAIEEMARILKPSGRGLIYVWAKNQEADCKKSSYLRQNKENNRKFEKKSKENSKQDSPEDIKFEQVEQNIALPVHTNRTQFKHKDLLVPWKLKDNAQTKNSTEAKTFLRFYHVFDEDELETVCSQISDIKVTKSYYDQGNWCVIFEKL